MNERIKQLRKFLNLTQQEFADRIKMKRNTIANYETDRNEPSNSVVSLICREFNVSERWLRNGEGEMFNELSVDEEFIKICVDIQVSDDDFIKRLLRIYWGLDDATKATIRKLINDLADK